ncbi:MAG: diguanylate cyclase [Proteobacteria bacterium]|nr:diguanylate cyclase [Pseudomonadota bacterium]MBU1738832.1 diguanylate cyclase [Pseudomonadota bacterium]
MYKSPLFRRFFYLILTSVLGLALAFYFLSVPYLKEKVYGMEELAARTFIDNLQELVEADHLSIEAYKESVENGHRQQLKNIVLFQENYLDNKLKQVRDGLLTEQEARLTALEELREFRYGNNDYVWVADYTGRYLSHPDPQLHLTDFSEYRDEFGTYILMPLVESARQNGEGFHRFWWHRLGEDFPFEKLAYAKLYPQWDWVIGTGVYLDDLKTEVILRREKMVDELRETVKRISSTNLGQIFIFDSYNNVIIHPDPALENNPLPDLKNILTGNTVAKDLIAAAGRPDNKVSYLWPPSPTETTKKIKGADSTQTAWVRYVKGFDWFIVFTISDRELNHTSIQLRNRILIVSAITVFFSILVITFLISRMLRPIRDLTTTASRVEHGDLSARCTVDSPDEIGFLAGAFNSMVSQLKDHIEQLDEKVLERTRELDEKNNRLVVEIAERKKMQEEVTTTNLKLQDWIERLEQRNREISILNKMGESLQACQTQEEAFAVISETMRSLFPQAAGALCTCKDGQEVGRVDSWNNYPAEEPATFQHGECQALRKGRRTVCMPEMRDGQPCSHLKKRDLALSMCLPLQGRQGSLGLIHLAWKFLAVYDGEDRKRSLDNIKRLATAATDHITLAIDNLRLREKLHRQSVRDGLTNLFNRRYMEESLGREFLKSERNQTPTGVIMLDVDFFKKFNDTYGHEAGDMVLIGLARLLTDSVRGEDIVCRYGGEEFIIVMPDSPLENIAARAEMIRTRVEKELHVDFHGKALHVTISLGVAAFPDHGRSQEAVLKAADMALYRAKESGRNRSVVWQAPDPA